MRKKDHLAINKTVREYEEHCDLLRKFVNDNQLSQGEVFELITSEVGYAITLLANNLLEFGEKE